MYRVNKFSFAWKIKAFPLAHYRVANLFFVRTFAHFIYFPLCCFYLKNTEKLLPCAYIVSTNSLYRQNVNIPFFHLSGKNRNKSMSNGDKSEKTVTKNDTPQSLISGSASSFPRLCPCPGYCPGEMPLIMRRMALCGDMLQIDLAPVRELVSSSGGA